MEVVLLWLDELDDLFFTGICRLERVRRICLELGLLAALIVAASDPWGLAAPAGFACAAIALTCVGIWGLVLFGSLLVQVRARAAESPA